MKYKTIDISPNLSKRSWNVFIKNDDKERVVKNTKPNALGFYHCFQSKPDNEAVLELIDCMIKRHNLEINNIKKSMDSLIKLREKWDK